MVPAAAPQPNPAKAGFSVPKKKFRSSVDRHRIRRLMWEGWRLHKHLIYAAIPPGMELHLFLIFSDTTLPDYAKVEAALMKAIGKLIARLQEGALPPVPSVG